MAKKDRMTAFISGGPGTTDRAPDIEHLPTVIERIKRDAKRELARLARLKPTSLEALSDVSSLRAMLATPTEQILAEIRSIAQDPIRNRRWTT